MTDSQGPRKGAAQGAMDAAKAAVHDAFDQMAEAQRLAGLGSWEWNMDTDRVVWSDQQFRLFGLQPGEAEPTWAAFQSFLHPEDVAAFQDAIQRGMRSRTSFEVPHRLQWRDGSVHHALSRGRFVPDARGRPRRLLGMTLDTSEQAMREEEARAELRQLEDALKGRSLFLANMSHQIRTPINAVIGMTRLLQDTPLSVEQQDFVETIRSSGEHLLTLVSDIVDFARLEGGRVELEHRAVPVRPLLRQALNLVVPRAAEKSIVVREEVALAVPAAVVGDEARIRQVLLNLLTNAVKFTHKGEVVVLVDALPRSPSGIVLHVDVRDTGVGIAPDRIDKVFQAYALNDPMAAREDGTGLGLAVSRRLVDAMGGRLWVESEPGRGSTFHLELPTQAAAAPPLPTEPAAAVPERLPLRVLVVEDNLMNRRVACKLLERIGVRAEVAANGQEALHKMRRNDYDVVLMDVQLPVMDGLAATKALRATEPAGTHVQVIAMTANAMPGDKEQCLMAGMDDYIAKPVRLEELSEAVVKAARRAGVVS